MTQVIVSRTAILETFTDPYIRKVFEHLEGPQFYIELGFAHQKIRQAFQKLFKSKIEITVNPGKQRLILTVEDRDEAILYKLQLAT